MSSPLALFDRLIKVVVGGITRVLTCPGPSPFVLIAEVNIVYGGSGGHPIPHVSSRPSLFSQSSIVGKKIGDIFGLLTDIRALVLAILVDILKLLEGLDNVDVVTEIDDDVLRAGVQTVIEESQRLKQIPRVSDRPEWAGNCVRTLKTCLQFFPLSFSRLSRTSIISTKSFLGEVEMF